MEIPASLYWRTKLMHRFKGIYKTLGDFESWILKSELQSIKIIKPVYISSLARSGTTIITEMLAELDNTCSHTYGDFPGVFTPYWNNWLKQRKSFLKESKSERAHADRIYINNDSPDAFEEVLWMYFFPQLHQQYDINFLENKQFVDYYQQHLKKHLLVKNATRYIAKANYNISRIRPILKMFPDAKFIIPIRHPVNHIASLMKQHKIYINAAKNNHKIDKQLAISGHFEFGNLREALQIGEYSYANRVASLWINNQEIVGWAEYWLGFYRAVSELQRQLPDSIKIIRYEQLCKSAGPTINDLFDFCQFEADNLKTVQNDYVNKLSLPKYYEISFDSHEIKQILKITQTVADDFGYNAENFN